jgi:type IV pilus assembly protein PilY1
VLATDGNPTGRTDGQQYDPSQWINTQTNGVWTWGQAQQDVFGEITALKDNTILTGPNLSNPALANQKFEVKTYVLGMGDTVANASSVAALNEMARLGGAYATAFLGNSAASIQSAFQTIVGDVLSKTSAAAAVALNSGSWSEGSRVYQAKFNSTDWSGSLAAYPVSTATGTIGTTAVWDVATQLRGQNWNTQRNIVTYKPSAALGSRGVPFRWPANPATPTASEMDAAQSAEIDRDASGTTDANGAARLAWLRGDPSREQRNCATPPCAAPQFRNRAVTPLGDIINSAPYYVAAPAFGYFDDFEVQPYSTFVSTYRNRTPVIYVGANDGMLHAISAATGNELFAYVPAALYGGLSQLSSPSYGHRYFADGSPTVGDVFYDNAWHTLLVAGMRSGAKGVYALDVTNPANFAEGNAGSIVRWEFQDPDLGYVFSQPLIVKTNNGRWSVIVSGGYDVGNASGRAMLFVLDAQTGALVRKFDTLAGTALSPNGLSSPAAIDGNGDGIVDLVYAGDLNGNLWKFDLTSGTTTDWALGNGAAALFSTPGGQPITSRPDVTRFPRGGFLVGFGTGRYLAVGDQTDTSAQSIYAILDPNNGIASTAVLTDLQQQTIVGTGTRSSVVYRLSTHAVGPSDDTPVTGDNVIARTAYLTGKKGWYLNLPGSGERVVADARFRGGRLIFTSIIPDASAPCAFGGTGWLLEFDAITGNRLDTATFDTDDNFDLNAADYVTFPQSGTGSNNVSGRRLGAISAAPGFLASGKLDLRLLNKADGTVEVVRGSLGLGTDSRAMWREVR